MLEALAGRLLWDKELSKPFLRLWGVALLLAPLALLGALYLQWRIQVQVPVRIHVDREIALDTAHRFVETRGLDTSGWTVTVDTDDEQPIYRHLVRQGEKGKQLLGGPGGWMTVQVRMEHPERTQGLTLNLAQNGTVTGFKHWYEDDHAFGKELTAAAAQERARAALQEILQTLPMLQLGDCELTTRKDSQGAQYTYACPLGTEGIAGLEARGRVYIRGSEIVEAGVKFDLTDSAERAVRLSKAADGFFFPYAGLVMVVMMVRYFKRRAQKEVSRQRMLLVTLIIGCFVMAQVLLEDEPIDLSNADVQLPSWMPLLLFGLLAYAAGQGAGVAYAAAEGDLRERRPSWLISLDALLSGKLLSRNVGRSVVLGTVVLAWLMLARGVVYTVAQPEFAGVDGFWKAYPFLFSRVPWLSLVLGALSLGVFKALAAMLCPVVIAERWRRRRWVALGMLVAASIVTMLFVGQEPVRGVGLALMVMVHVAALQVAFFAVDVLGLLTVAVGFSFFHDMVGLTAISPLWEKYDQWALLVGGGWVAVQTVCAFRGRIVEAAEVRPEYAADIHERQMLESEVAAAKEAQQRLLPGVPPQVLGLALAASCRANEVVSGDFFDYFPISKSRLAILLCDGGGNGLATALTIALAKGFLMHKSQAGLSPLETLRELRRALGRELEGQHAEGLLYAVMDVGEGTLRFARHGATPAICCEGLREWEISGESGMWEGEAQFAGRASLVLYSNGLSQLVGGGNRAKTNRWLRKRILGAAQAEAGDLHSAILKQAFRRRVGFGARNVKDDVTVIVCQVDPRAVQEAAVVA